MPIVHPSTPIPAIPLPTLPPTRCPRDRQPLLREPLTRVQGGGWALSCLCGWEWYPGPKLQPVADVERLCVECGNPCSVYADRCESCSKSRSARNRNLWRAKARVELLAD